MFITPRNQSKEMASRLLLLRRLVRVLPKPSYTSIRTSSCIGLAAVDDRPLYWPASNAHHFFPESCRRFSSGSMNLDESQSPTAIDYSSLLQEDEFHRLADSTIHDLQERFEDYGDSIDLDGFDIDYGNDVLTLKLGDLGTYVLNKQTPNRQIWLSSPVSGPSRYDWDTDAQSWIYRRNKANLLKVLETEVENLCGQPIKLS